MSNSILDGLTYQSDKPMLQTEITPEMLELYHKKDKKGERLLNERQLETISATQTANQLLENMGQPNVSDFMTNLAMQESQLGKQTSPVSYSPFQIDPIGYQDFVEKADVNQPGGGSYNRKRVNFVNEFLRNAGYGEDFDIAGFSFDKNTVDDKLREPLIGALVTRMKLGSIPGKLIPTDLQGQADYWKDYWNTKAGKGEPKDFISQVQYYNSMLGNKTHDDTPIQ